MPQAVKRRRFTLEEYHRMGEAGILADDPRIELLAGAVVVREPTGSRHAGTVDRIAHLFFSRLAGRAIVRVQNPVAFPDEMSELQPDVTLLRLKTDFWAGLGEAWLVDLTTERVEVFRRLTGGHYRDVARLARGAGLTPLAFPDLALVVDDLLG